MRARSCITSYPLRGLPYLPYDNVNPAMVNSMMLVNPAMVNSMMLRSSMHAFEKVYSKRVGDHPGLVTLCQKYSSHLGTKCSWLVKIVQWTLPSK